MISMNFKKSSKSSKLFVDFGMSILGYRLTAGTLKDSKPRHAVQWKKENNEVFIREETARTLWRDSNDCSSIGMRNNSIKGDR